MYFHKDWNFQKFAEFFKQEKGKLEIKKLDEAIKKLKSDLESESEYLRKEAEEFIVNSLEFYRSAEIDFEDLKSNWDKYKKMGYLDLMYKGKLNRIMNEQIKSNSDDTFKYKCVKDFILVPGPNYIGFEKCIGGGDKQKIVNERDWTCKVCKDTFTDGYINKIPIVVNDPKNYNNYLRYLGDWCLSNCDGFKPLA